MATQKKKPVKKKPAAKVVKKKPVVKAKKAPVKKTPPISMEKLFSYRIVDASLRADILAKKFSLASVERAVKDATEVASRENRRPNSNDVKLYLQHVSGEGTLAGFILEASRKLSDS